MIDVAVVMIRGDEIDRSVKIFADSCNSPEKSFFGKIIILEFSLS